MANPVNLEQPSRQSLAELATSIKAEHAALTVSSRDIVQRAVKIGEDILKAKAQLPHGQFLKWVKGVCGLSDKTAQRYMMFASNKEKLRAVAQAKYETISDLTLNAAQRLIAGGAGSSDSNVLTKLDRFENSWGKLDAETQRAFIEIKYNDITALMADVDRKSKAA